jgi:phosphatidylglycerophosphatase A
VSRWRWPETAVVTVLYTGFSPIAPGTVASALTCAILWFAPPLLRWPWALLLIPVTLWGVHLSTRACEYFKVVQNSPFAKLRRPNPHEGDPDQVVIDEFVGQWITLLAASHNVLSFLGAVLVFRLFDITKPLGVRTLEKLPGGWGIMLDDVLAGVWGAILIVLAQRLATYLFS